MDILLWLFDRHPFPFQCFLISSQKRNCIKEGEYNYIYVAQMPRLVCELLKNLGIFNLEIRCAFEREILSLTRTLSKQGADRENVVWLLSSWWPVYPEWLQQASAKVRDGRDGWAAAFGSHLTERRHYLVGIALTILRKERTRDSRQFCLLSLQLA